MNFRYLILLVLFISCSSKSSLDDQFNKFLDEEYETFVSLSPQWQTYLGRKTNNDKLDDNSLDKDEEVHELEKESLRKLYRFDYNKLSSEEKLSYKLHEYNLVNSIENYYWKDHNFPVNQMFGAHSSLVSLMINNHSVDSLQDAEAYIKRIKGFEKYFNTLISNLKRRESKKIIAPLFAIEKVINDSENLIELTPIDEHPIYSNFSNKISKLSNKSKNKILLKDLEIALNKEFKNAYLNLITYLKKLKTKAQKEVPAKSLPEGKEFYYSNLRNITTTDYSPEKIHKVGLDETKRIHNEMKKIKSKVKFKGSLKKFFAHLKTSDKFFYPDNQKGRDQYLDDTNQIISNIKKKLPEIFGILPKADLTVKPVEKFREQSAGLAFYQGPSEDGKRPGIYYVNLYDMKSVNKFEMEALAYHEAIPGHHMQIAISKELKHLPKFRRNNRYISYIEGWALYAESLGKELNLYQDPYSDFGRLSMELWRAARLVIDTGIHYYGWSLDKSIKWLDENTPSTHADNIKAVQRYTVMPAQATAYKIGMLKILELRSMAKSNLKDNFSLKEFHDEILRYGPLPLNILEERITYWISRKKGE